MCVAGYQTEAGSSLFGASTSADASSLSGASLFAPSCPLLFDLSAADWAWACNFATAVLFGPIVMSICRPSIAILLSVTPSCSHNKINPTKRESLWGQIHRWEIFSFSLDSCSQQTCSTAIWSAFELIFTSIMFNKTKEKFLIPSKLSLTRQKLKGFQ